MDPILNGITFIRSPYILSSRLCLCLTSDSFLPLFDPKCSCISPSSHACYMFRPSHSPLIRSPQHSSVRSTHNYILNHAIPSSILLSLSVAKIFSSKDYVICCGLKGTVFHINPLALELDIYNLAHHLCKM